MTKVHMGCGTVYLEGWINVDMPGPNCHLVNSNNRELVERWKTTEEKGYYARHQDVTMDSLRAGPMKQEYVCDLYGSFMSIPTSLWEMDELLSRQVFEHMSITEARRALDEVESKMKPGGILRIDVPDHEETFKKYRETGDEFYKRHFLGPRKDEHGYHIMSYTRELLRKVVEEHGFIYESEEPNIHLYPAFCLRFRKPGAVRPSWDYLKGMFPEPKPEEKVLEIGPGTNPWKRSDAFADFSAHVLNDLSKTEKPRHQADFNGNTGITSGLYDFIFAAHIVEHLDNLQNACDEMARIAKRGVIIVPSMYKDFLFNFEEGDHKWSFIPNNDPKKPLYCYPMDYVFRSNTADSNFCAATCRLFRTGPNRFDSDQRTLRRWFDTREKYLDVIHYWEGRPDIRILSC